MIWSSLHFFQYNLHLIFSAQRKQKIYFVFFLFDLCCRDTQYALFECFVRKTLDDIRADKKVRFEI